MDQQTQTPEQPAAAATIARQLTRLYRFSMWVHVGPDAENCSDVDEDAGTNACGDPLHFHAWCRLPNAFQQRDIRNRGLAAKARRARQLRDPSTDGYEILEGEMESFAARGDDSRPELIAELLQAAWWERYFEAVAEVAEEEDDRVLGPGEEQGLKWEHIDDDRERFAVLDALPEEDRPKDEYDELSRRLTAHYERVMEVFEGLERPLKESLEAKDVSELIDLVRQQRVDHDTQQAFTDTYSAWLWLTCTLVQPEGRPRWHGVEEIYEAPSEVLAVVGAAFDDLDRANREAQTGN